jgi:protein TonB
MISLCTNKINRLLVLTFSPILIALMCVACGNKSSVDSPAASDVETSTAPKATGLVKNPVKLSDTADAVKWMDIASSKSALQLAKEEQLAREARETKLAAEARETKLADDARVAKLAADAKDARDAKLAADAKTAEEARLAAARVSEAQKVALAATAPPVVVPKAAPVAPLEPVLKVVASEQPKFPKNAGLDGVTSGMVTAQVYIEPDGSVSKVEILKATPKKYFEKAVIAAALRWRYSPISKPTTATLEFNFKLDSDGT